VVGDGGHGRGYLQIDDRAHPAFLRKHGALDSGVPPAREAARTPRSACSTTAPSAVGRA
jgi:hypothetical protein